MFHSQRNSFAGKGQLTEIFRSEKDGFPLVGLRSEVVEISIVPALGARVFSLFNRHTRREWMWSASEKRKLFPNAFGDAFEQGTLTGADECIPTILPCRWKGRDLPDHGEVWSRSWQLDEKDLAAEKLTTSVTLPLTPFLLTRTISLNNADLRFDYQLESKAPESEPFLWSWHPLLCFEDGDYFELPSPTEDLKVEIALNPTGARGETWPVERLRQMAGSQDGFLKAFVPAGNGKAALVHGKTKERLELSWNPDQLPWLGIWITRGGWNGYHHAALEPTHGAPDALDVAVEQWRAHATLACGETTHWHMNIHLTE